jgi:AAA15 family ATPase/GTPase
VNHKSIRDEQELSLLPIYETDRAVQTLSAIYGANASGKSTVLDGLRFMRTAVLESYSRWEPDQGVPRQPFRLDPQARAEPSQFVVDLDLDGVRYTYGFSVDDEVVREEWLYSYPEKKRRIIFERTYGDIKFGSTVPAHRSKAVLMEELTRANALFLSVASRVNFTELLPVYDWFRSKLRFRLSGQASSDAFLVDVLARFADRSPHIYRTIVELLRFADVGITDIRIESFEDARLATESESIRHRKRLLFTHSSHGDSFEMRDESAGTRAWLDILRVVLTMLDQGGTLLVDEIDTSLHPALTARLMALFQQQETNPRSAQLVCTTHDTTLLSPTLGEQVVTRGQVWFTEKNSAGETRLYPLSDFRPRLGENTERRYLGGSYGAVPKIFREDIDEAVSGSIIGSTSDDQA